MFSLKFQQRRRQVVVGRYSQEDHSAASGSARLRQGANHLHRVQGMAVQRIGEMEHRQVHSDRQLRHQPIGLQTRSGLGIRCAGRVASVSRRLQPARAELTDERK